MNDYEIWQDPADLMPTENPIKARNYRQVETCLSNREPFDHSTMSARWEGGLYRVRSYRTEIATYHPVAGETWVSENHWGRTTGKHLGYCRRNLPRIRSNDPSALNGIGPGSRVEWEHEAHIGRVLETHPLAGAVRVDFNTHWDGEPDIQVVPREALELA